MTSVPEPLRFAVLLGLSFFLGLAYERFFGSGLQLRRPGGIRTFPLLAIAGGLLYLLDPTRFVPFSVGLATLGAWLLVFYNKHISELDEEGEPNVGLVVPVINILAYVLGALALALPSWVCVGATVSIVLFLTARDRLHQLARGMDMKEITTAGEFLILTGIVLPLLPDSAVTTLTSITPRQAWLALVVVCSLSYVSYLAQRFWPAAAKGLYMAALGGLYSSTATTVVLARQSQSSPSMRGRAQAGITLASAISFLRFLVIVAVFDRALALRLIGPFGGMAALAVVICAIQYWRAGKGDGVSPASVARNPLELVAAATFAALFILTSLASSWVRAHLGIEGIYSLASLIGLTDIDPFVLNLAQGGIPGSSSGQIAAAILIAASANNVAKAAYAFFFSGAKRVDSGVVALLALAVCGMGFAGALATGYL